MMWILRLALAAMLTVSVACGGGGGSSSQPVPTGIAASFTSAEPNPGNNTVAASQTAASGDTVTVALNVSGAANIVGAAFDLTYDGTRFRFDGWLPGSLLEGSGASVQYEVNSSTPGMVVVGVASLGGSGVTTVGTTPLIRLRFRATAPGSSQLSFERPALLDDQVPPQPINNLLWFGGTLLGN